MKILTNTEKDKMKYAKLNDKNIKIIKENKMDYLLDSFIASMPKFCKSYIPLKCDWELHDKIAEGMSGDIYSACCKDDCKYILKWQKFGGGEVGENTFKNEIKYQNIFADLGFSVPVVESYICEEGAFLIMPALDITLLTILRESNIEDVKAAVLEALDLIENLHEKGYYHGDTHLGNIMYGENMRDNMQDKLYLIDLESAGELTPEEERRDFAIFLRSLKDEVYWLPESDKREELYDFYDNLKAKFDERFL